MKNLTLILALLTVSFGFAQWNGDTSKNTKVTDYEAMSVLSEATSDGKTYTVYWKEVPAPAHFELRMQIIDTDGTILLEEGGVLVSDQIPMGSYTVLASSQVDSDDNLYIGVTGTGGGEPVYVFKYDVEGNPVWGDDGVQVGSGNKATMLPLTSGNLLVSWLSNAGTFMQMINEVGEQVWSEAKPLSPAGSLTAPDYFFELSNDDYIAVYHKLSYGINSTLYAQRYDSNGDEVWDEPVQVSDGTTKWNRYYDGLVKDDAVYFAYFAAFGNQFRAFVQRIDADGNLPWGINGAEIDIEDTYYQMETSITSDDDVIWAVSRYTDWNQSEVGTYVQKFDDQSGERLLGETGKMVFEVGSLKRPTSKIQILDGKPVFLIRDGVDNGASPIELRAVLLDENGDFYWEEETKPIATYEATKSNVYLLPPANNQIVAVFTEDKGDGTKLYAQNLVEEVLAVGDLETASIFIANPIDEILRIQSDASITNVAVYNVMGQLHYTSDFYNQTDISIPSGHWTSGIYFVSLTTDEGLHKTIKVIKR